MSAARALPHWWSRRGSPRPPPLLTLPAAAIAVVMLLPVAYLLVRSLGASQEAWDLLFRARTAEVLFRTALLVATVTAVSVGLAAPLAWLTVKTDLPMRRVWMVLTTLPLVIPSYVGAFLIVSALGPKGLLQQALSGPLGVERLPDIHGLAGATITLSFLSYPYVLLTLRGSFSRLDPALEESARSLGLGPWSTFRRVTLPLLRPAMAAGALLVALYTLSDFGAVSLLRYETFTWAIYQQYQSFDRSLAALLSLVLVALALLVLFAESRGPGRLRYHQAGGGAPRRLAIVRRRRWKWPALAFCSVVTAVSLVFAGLRPALLARTRRLVRRATRVHVGSARQLGLRLGAGRHRRGRMFHTGRRPDRALPGSRQPRPGATEFYRVRAARHCRRAVTGLLRGELRTAPSIKRSGSCCWRTWCCSSLPRWAPPGRPCCRSARDWRRWPGVSAGRPSRP